jgi:hypothetical protein
MGRAVSATGGMNRIEQNTFADERERYGGRSPIEEVPWVQKYLYVSASEGGARMSFAEGISHTTTDQSYH